MLGPITKQIRRHLRDNEIADKSHGWKSGRFHSRSLIKGEVTGTEKLYARRDEKGQMSYAVGLLIDASGSMRSGAPDVTPHPEVFGGLGATNKGYTYEHTEDYSSFYGGRSGKTYGAKWTFATRLCVALSEAIGKYREVKVGIFRFDNDFTVVKQFTQPFSQEVKQHVMDDITGNVDGGTENAKAFRHIADQMSKLNVDKRLCIVLTDGQFTDYGTDEAIKYMKNKGIEMVVLTLGCDAGTAKQYVGDNFADKVTDESVGPVLGHHLKRMVRDKSGK
jgi:hypothetical protein